MVCQLILYRYNNRSLKLEVFVILGVLSYMTIKQFWLAVFPNMKNTFLLSKFSVLPCNSTLKRSLLEIIASTVMFRFPSTLIETWHNFWMCFVRFLPRKGLRHRRGWKTVQCYALPRISLYFSKLELTLHRKIHQGRRNAIRWHLFQNKAQIF